jgi:hypothetical protein
MADYPLMTGRFRPLTGRHASESQFRELSTSSARLRPLSISEAVACPLMMACLSSYDGKISDSDGWARLRVPISWAEPRVRPGSDRSAFPIGRCPTLILARSLQTAPLYRASLENKQKIGVACFFGPKSGRCEAKFRSAAKAKIVTDATISHFGEFDLFGDLGNFRAAAEGPTSNCPIISG